ncbi:MAG TPA: hypothetical protein V6D19_02075 [Stenomitos sp.]
MSVEFALWRISPEFVKALQDFGGFAFDLFWESDLIDDDDLWTEDKIQENFFSDGKSYFQDFPRDLMLPILSEGCEIFRSLDKSFSTNGKFVEGIHFLLAGKHQFHRHDFIVKEVSLLDDRTLILVNVLVGMHKVKEEAGLYVTYLTAVEVEAAARFLPRIFNDDFDMRWKMLQELDQGSEYLPPYHENPQWTQEMIDSEKRWRHSFKERLRRSFSERFHPEEPRQFLQDELLPFLLKAGQLGCGVLASRTS